MRFDSAALHQDVIITTTSVPAEGCRRGRGGPIEDSFEITLPAGVRTPSSSSTTVRCVASGMETWLWGPPADQSYTHERARCRARSVLAQGEARQAEGAGKAQARRCRQAASDGLAGAAEIQRAKPRANGHLRQATASHIQPLSRQVNAMPGHVGRSPAT